MIKVQKRDGSKEKFNYNKIFNAVSKAFKSCNKEMTADFQDLLYKNFTKDNPRDEKDKLIPLTVETIQDRIQTLLYENGYRDVYDSYIIYRYNHKMTREYVKSQKDFIEKYKKSDNNANATIDDNSNVSTKNIGTMNSEAHKKDNISTNRGIMLDKLKTCFSDFDHKNYLRDLNHHYIYKHDESSFAGLSPYCVSASMYPFLTNGIQGLGGLSAAPQNLDSFCGIFINWIFAMASQFAGACLYKDQRLLIRKNDELYYTTIKDFISQYNLQNSFTNHQGDWAFTSDFNGDNLEVWENGKFVDITKLYMRKYNNKIYKITTWGGKEIYTSKDHIFKVRFHDRDFEVKSENLQLGDTLYRTDFNLYPINKNSKSYRDGQIHGIIAGDGHIYNDGVRISINYKEKFISDFLDNYFEEYYGKKGFLRNGHKCFDYQFNSREYAHELMNNIFDGIKTESKSLKDDVFDNANFDYLCGFLDGILATDGGFANCTHYITLINKKLIDQIKTIVGYLGCYVSPVKYQEKSGSFENAKPSYGLSISKRINNYLDLTSARRKNVKTYWTLPKNTTYYYGGRAFKHSRGKGVFHIGDYKNIPYKYLDAVKSIDIIDNDDEYVYEIETTSHWYSAGGIITHNCASPEALVCFDYYARKEWGNDYYLHSDEVITSQLCAKQQTIKSQIHQYFQQIVYSINQPTASRGMQSAFWNVSYFDKPFFEGMFSNFYFPDGTQPIWDSVSWLQKEFMRWFNEERLRVVLTFPVESFAVIYKDGEFLDKDTIDFIAEEYADGHSFFTYISDTVDSLASCCRLRNSLKTKEFNFTNGNMGVMTGSKSVMTLNLNRIIQDFFKTVSQTREGAIDIWKNDLNNEIHTKLASFIEDILDRTYKYQTAYNEGLWDMYDANMLPAYKSGFIDLNKQYLTIGINGLNEAAEYLGMTISDNDEYRDFCTHIFKTIKDSNTQHNGKFNGHTITFNTECVPAESLSAKNYNWDKEDGYWVPEDRNLYASYVFLPSDSKINIFEKIRMHGRNYIGDFLDGGAAAHLNLSEHLSKKQYSHILKYAGDQGCNYLTFNVPNSQCAECGFITKSPISKCPHCGSEHIYYYDRIIGYLTRIDKWSTPRQIEQKTRVYEAPKYLTK